MGSLVYILQQTVMPIELGYMHSIQGRGTKLRVLLAHAGVDYKFVSPTLAHLPDSYLDKPWQHQYIWHKIVKPEMRKTFPLVNLPYVIDGDAKVAGEKPCLDYLSDKLGYFGETDAEKANVKSLCDIIFDLEQHCMKSRLWVFPKGPVTENVKNLLLPHFLEKIASQIEASSKTYAVSNKVTLADIMLVICIQEWLGSGNQPLSVFLGSNEFTPNSWKFPVFPSN